MNLTYISNSQIIDDAAKSIIKRHLEWEGSCDGMPSDMSHAVLRSAIIDAYIAANYTAEEWCAMDELKREAAGGVAKELADRAAKEADRRWNAALVLLGLWE